MRGALFLFCVLAGCFLGCASQPKLLQARFEPKAVTAGDDVRFVVVFSGKQIDLKEVFLTVREYPDEYPKIPLSPDTTSQGNVWVHTVTLPYEPPADIYHMDINAIDKKGQEIIGKGFEKNTTSKAGTIELPVD